MKEFDFYLAIICFTVIGIYCSIYARRARKDGFPVAAAAFWILCGISFGVALIVSFTIEKV